VPAAFLEGWRRSEYPWYEELAEFIATQKDVPDEFSPVELAKLLMRGVHYGYLSHSDPGFLSLYKALVSRKDIVRAYPHILEAVHLIYPKPIDRCRLAVRYPDLPLDLNDFCPPSCQECVRLAVRTFGDRYPESPLERSDALRSPLMVNYWRGLARHLRRYVVLPHGLSTWEYGFARPWRTPIGYHIEIHKGQARALPEDDVPNVKGTHLEVEPTPDGTGFTVNDDRLPVLRLGKDWEKYEHDLRGLSGSVVYLIEFDRDLYPTIEDCILDNDKHLLNILPSAAIGARVEYLMHDLPLNRAPRLGGDGDLYTTYGPLVLRVNSFRRIYLAGESHFPRSHVLLRKQGDGSYRILAATVQTPGRTWTVARDGRAKVQALAALPAGSTLVSEAFYV